MTNAVKELGFISIPCTLHTLQLVINDALKEQELKGLLKEVSQVVKYFHKSTKANDFFKERQKSLLKLKKRNKTRWNSSFYMIERLLNLQTPLNSILSQTECTIQHLEPTTFGNS